jgi:hypothetical protein
VKVIRFRNNSPRKIVSINTAETPAAGRSL